MTLDMDFCSFDEVVKAREKYTRYKYKKLDIKVRNLMYKYVLEIKLDV